MPGTFPTSPAPMSVDIFSYQKNFRSESMSGKEYVRTIGAHRWDITATFPPMRRADFSPAIAFLESQGGGAESFQIILPYHSQPSDLVSGTITANGVGAVGAKSIGVYGFSGTLKAGNYFKFANHNKVYLCTADRAGSGSLSFMPGLLFGVSSDEQIQHTDVPFTVRQANGIQKYKSGVGGVFNFELDLKESL